MDDDAIHSDVVVLASIQSGWLLEFQFHKSDFDFKFVVVTAAGHAALEAET